MSISKRQKWDAGVAVTQGKKSVNLLQTHQSELSARISEDEKAQHEANIVSLEKRISGQEVKLSGQKSNTAGQNTIIKLLNGRVSSIRNIVKDANGSTEILKAFGVGNRITLTVLGISSAADTIITAYNQFRDWSNKAGIIDSDMEELTTITNSLFDSDSKQAETIYIRKAATMDKNTLQRCVEDMVTKISNLGYHEFELKNPAVAKLFSDLIPSAPSKNKKEKTLNVKS